MGFVSIQNVSFSYQADSQGHGISEISLEIQKGECVLLCGKSGSGKTTISKLVNGLIPHFETGRKTGVVLLDGMERLNRRDARARMPPFRAGKKKDRSISVKKRLAIRGIPVSRVSRVRDGHRDS